MANPRKQGEMGVGRLAPAGWMIGGCTFNNGLSVSSDRQTLVSTYLLHLLDCQWQDYDFTLISDLQLPEFLIHSAVSKFHFPVPTIPPFLCRGGGHKKKC